jgi:hypothetical protein
MRFKDWFWPIDLFEVHPFEGYIRSFYEDRSFLFDGVLKLDVLSLMPRHFDLFWVTHGHSCLIDFSSSLDLQSDDVVFFVILSLSHICQFN